MHKVHIKTFIAKTTFVLKGILAHVKEDLEAATAVEADRLETDKT